MPLFPEIIYETEVFAINRTALKIIACLTMLIDHMGLLLFPQAEWMRWIGRLAFPLFAFFIAEGCRHTSNKLRYFSRVLITGVFCQAVFIAAQAVAGRVYSYYFNTLITFSLAILLCYAYLYHEKTAESGHTRKAMLSAFLFLSAILCAVGLCALLAHIDRTTYYEVYLDYGLPGLLLPLAALAFRDKQKQFVGFSFGIIVFCLVCRERVPFVWYALADIPLLALYNGKKGKHTLKYGFYLFYPIHLGILYLLQMIF